MKINIPLLFFFISSSIINNLFCFIPHHHTPSQRIVHFDQNSLSIISCFETDHDTHITLLENENKEQFIVKQDTRENPYWYIKVIRDKLGSYIAEDIDIQVNHIDIIPIDFSFIGKPIRKSPATLHQVVPGILVKRLPKELKQFSVRIQQEFKKNTPKKARGLNWHVITDMAKHPDLPKIVALDTFIANGDRHRGNFLFDPISNHYFIIDLESSFNKNLAYYAHQYILFLLHDIRTTITAEELNGLCIYNDTLKKLIYRFPPEHTYKKMIDFAIEAGFMQLSYRKTIFPSIMPHKIPIEQNYDSCQKLVKTLDLLIAKHTYLKRKK